MKAVIVEELGGPENLITAEVPDPTPSENEALVDVAYCGCNWADTMIRIGTYPHSMTYPVILGLEISGRVVALGAKAKNVRVGDRVAAFIEKGGGYAQKCAVPADLLIAIPPGMSLETAAAFPIQSLTAYHMLHSVAGVKPDDTVLIHAIGGGVGLQLTQLAVKAGARVIGTVGTPGKERRALDYGAERVVLTRNEDFEAAVLDFTRGRGVDLALDSLGATTLDRTFNVVRKLGRIISYGEAEGQPFKNIRERILPRSQTFTRFHLGHVDPGSTMWRQGLEYVLQGIMTGWLKVPVERIYKMDQAKDMHVRIESRQVSGKLLLSLAS
jgi:NADPH2:quinone reductase